jgi:hypothetical protein
MGFLKIRTLEQTTGFAKTLIVQDNIILGFMALGVGARKFLSIV